MVNPHARDLYWDGARLAQEPTGGGRRFSIDARCLEAEAVPGCFAHVCALPEEDAAIPFDQPEVQEARRAALAWWIPLLGEALVCMTTLSIDGVHFAGAITVARNAAVFSDDPFASLFPGTIVETGVFGMVAPPPGPLIERIAGAPWPGGRFPDP